MSLSNRRYRVLLPLLFVFLHGVLTGVAEIQYRTGWLYIPPTVSIDPSPPPIAAAAAIGLSLPAYVVSAALTVIAGFGVDGTALLVIETPFIFAFWLFVGNLLDSRRLNVSSIQQ